MTPACYLQQYRHHSLIQVLPGGQIGQVLLVFLTPGLRPLARVPGVLQRPLDGPGPEVWAEAPGQTGHDSCWQLTADSWADLTAVLHSPSTGDSCH